VAIAARQQVLMAAHEAHPERFVRGTPKPPALPTAVWINPPRASEPALGQLSVMCDQVQVSLADASQPIFLKFGPEVSQTA